MKTRFTQKVLWQMPLLFNPRRSVHTTRQAVQKWMLCVRMEATIFLFFIVCVAIVVNYYRMLRTRKITDTYLKAASKNCIQFHSCCNCSTLAVRLQYSCCGISNKSELSVQKSSLWRLSGGHKKEKLVLQKFHFLVKMGK